jgi:hypothetical protein
MMPGQTRSGQRPLHACGDILRALNAKCVDPHYLLRWVSVPKVCQPHLHVHRILRESMEAPLKKKSPPKIIAKWVDSLAIKSLFDLIDALARAQAREDFERPRKDWRKKARKRVLKPPI